LILAIFPIYNLNAVAVTVHYSGIEVSVLFVAASRRSIGASTRVQSGGIKFPDGSTAWCGESYVRCAGFDTRCLLANEEIGIADTKANLTALLTNKSISQWLKSSEEERAGSRKVRDSQTNMRDRHGIRGMRMIAVKTNEGLEGLEV